MKKLIILLITFVFFITACDSGSIQENKTIINTEFNYTLYYDVSVECIEIEEVIFIYGDETYYFPCQKSPRYTLTNIDGDEYSIDEIISNNLLSTEQLITILEGEIHKRFSTNIEKASYNFDINFYSVEELNTINNVVIYKTENSLQDCDTPFEFWYKDIHFMQSSGCDNTFLALGYFGVLNGHYFELEQLLSINKLNEVDIANLIYEGTDIDIESAPTNGLSTFVMLYVYMDDSPYHYSVVNEVNNFVNTYSINFDTLEMNKRYQDLNQTPVRPHIPYLKVTVGDKIGYYHGFQIIEFIRTFESSNINTEFDLRQILPEYQYDYKYGEVNGYEIVRQKNGSTLYMSYEFKVGDYYFNASSQYFYSGYICDFLKIGIAAYKDNQFYTLTSLIENEEIDIEDLVRLFPLVGKEPKYN